MFWTASYLSIWTRPSPLRDALAGTLAPWAVAVDGEVVVERRDAGEAEALHHGEAGHVDEREGPVGEVAGDPPGAVEVGGSDGHDLGGPVSDRRPEGKRRVAAEPAG